MNADGTDTDVDVLVVGYGPVGQTLAILLARHGHRVGVLERWKAPYPRPRAVHFDDEIARVLADAGLADRIETLSEPGRDYDWQNAAGETLLHFDWSSAGPSGWCTANMFGQPELEATLGAEAESFETVTVRRGLRAVDVDDRGDHVVVTAVDDDGVETRTSARYVVGCDGANSFVRSRMDTTVTDLGFFYDWLIVDVIPHDPTRVWEPSNLQVCDPVRPTTRVSGGPGRRRWEFLRLPDETVEQLNTESTAWRLLEPWDVHPGNATLERHTVYTFQARWADRWRIGRVMVAGDAAHLMPPFAGQGMCSGIRDTANLAWKLDLVLTGRADDSLLDTYTSERSAHVQHSIGMSVALGNVICLTDPEAVAARDARMLAAGGRPDLALGPVPPPVLGPGIVRTAADGAPEGPAGQLGIQARVRDAAGTTGRFDQVVGTGFVIGCVADPSAVLDDGTLAAVRLLGARVVQFLPEGAHPQALPDVTQVVDVEGKYLEWFAAGGHAVFVARPDFYLFGTAATVDGLPALVADLTAQLGMVAAAV
ncbi:bifunctional 3-(3-hydroxy-phenyl)propionate/3-hydroxycinnamic acid hydroxylase MhpA [Jatrophihabitans fulvus]